MNVIIDIDIDWNEEDDTGLSWTTADRAAFPELIQPGALVIAGRDASVAVAEVVDRDENGVVHLRPMPGSISDHAELLRTRRVRPHIDPAQLRRDIDAIIDPSI